MIDTHSIALTTIVKEFDLQVVPVPVFSFPVISTISTPCACR